MKFVEAITRQSQNQTLTLNGAVSNKSSLNAVLDLFSMGVSSSQKEKLVLDALNEDFILGTKAVFYLRDVRNGQGNKDIARAYHKILRANIDDKRFRKKYLKTLWHMPEIGSWKDLYEMYGAHKKVDKQIRKIVAVALGHEDGLAAKWFPRQSKFHKDLAKDMDMDIGELRRLIVKMTNVVETQMCNNEWHAIKYDQVPSVANKKYSKAFLLRDNSRREQFLNKVIKGEAKIKSSVLYPHDILGKLGLNSYGRCNGDLSANALWKGLPDYMEGSEHKNVLPIIDTSGSMFRTAGGTSGTKCIDIAVGLGLYFSEHNKGGYKDVWCNYSTNPTFMKLYGDTLSQRVSNLDFSNWSMSTNLQAVFDRIIQFGNYEDAPKVLLIVSDMEFNRCGPTQTNFQAAKQKFKEAGIEMPLIVFWRVDVKTTQQPVTIHDNGAILINGFSPSFVKEILKLDTDKFKNMTPINMMKNTLKDRYTFVDEIYGEK